MDPAFAQRWQAALEQGYARIEMALVQRAADALEGFAPDPDTPIPMMTVEQAIKVLDRHRATIEGGPPSRGEDRPRKLDELRERFRSCASWTRLRPRLRRRNPPPARRRG